MMGDRGQCLIEDEGVYLYTHWGATELEDIVRKAIAKGWRWGDPEYLARIIFCEMIKEDEEGETGFGIGTTEHSDIWRLVKINCREGTFTLIDNGETKYTKTFEQIKKEYIIDEIT